MASVLSNRVRSITQPSTSISSVPPHTHTFRQPAVNNAAADETNPAGSTFGITAAEAYFSGAANATMAPGTTDNDGGSGPVNVVNPFLGIYHCIALVGLFPSRN